MYALLQAFSVVGLSSALIISPLGHVPGVQPVSVENRASTVVKGRSLAVASPSNTPSAWLTRQAAAHRVVFNRFRFEQRATGLGHRAIQKTATRGFASRRRRLPVPATATSRLLGTRQTRSTVTVKCIRMARVLRRTTTKRRRPFMVHLARQASRSLAIR